MGYKFERYCKDYENIENYEKAAADNFKGWDCHHRLETHNSDGERRLVDISQKELIALGMYLNRPAEELIFMTESEHISLHKPSAETRKKMSEANKGKQLSEETKKKLSEANKGKQLSEEHKKNISEANKGKKRSEEARRKMSEAHKGKRFSEERKKNISEARRGKHWYNNGKINKIANECPPSFMPGRLRK